MRNVRPTCTAPVLEACRAQQGGGFFPPADELRDLPGRFAQEELPPEDVIIHLHYVGPHAHWWIAEIWQSREEPGTWEAYGYVRIHQGDAPEWCHISLTELQRVSLAIPVRTVGSSRSNGRQGNVRSYIERDLTWTPCPAHECIPGLTRAQESIDAAPAYQQGRRR